MADNTGIEWTDATWNPIRGCSRVSEGCRNCYAESLAKRFSAEGLPYEGLIAKGGQWNGQIKVVDHVMDQPLRWSKPRRIFVNSMSDLFHENVPDSVIDEIFSVMAAAKHHTFQVLTKRPERMRDYAKRVAASKPHDPVNSAVFDLVNAMNGGFAIWPLPNVWLGVSVEDQAAADERIPLLMDTPAAVRWVSAEPLLGRVDLHFHKDHCDLCGGTGILARFPKGKCYVCGGSGHKWINGKRRRDSYRKLDWVVVGGESGRNARPMHPQWSRNLRNQCKAAGVPFLFKQWGEWGPRSGVLTGGGPDFATIDPSCKKWPDVIRLGEHGKDTRIGENCTDDAGEDIYMQRVGKKAAGRMIDGVLHDSYPMIL